MRWKSRVSVVMLLVALALFATACGGGQTGNSNQSGQSGTSQTEQGGQGSSEKLAGVPEGVQGNIKIAVIRNLPSDDHTKQFLDGARSEGESFGFKVDTFIAENDDAKFQELVAQAIQKDYQGLIISHGKKDYSYDMIKPAIDKGIKVVAFDTVIDKDGASLPEVTTTFQNDHMLANLSLEAMVQDFSDRKPVRVIKLWFGGVPPLDRREEIYKQFEEQGKIQTLETIGPTNFQDVQGDIASKVSAILAKYPPGTVDAIWGSWDEMAKGAFKALEETGRKDIKLFSIDISNQDINLMRQAGSPWIATAAVDPRLIGIMDMRLLAMKLAGSEIPSTYELEPALVKQNQLKEDTNMLNLKDVVPGWGQSDDFDEPWMKTLREHYGTK
ncbi:MAG: putative sugar ABC transporter precursor [Candidatus Carbobacillus altaicus]|uniref:Putative sugar ABC transporter n=1 Tax=Candidatus Carbonibacillus altaicus TaxID=2163959 RepID=A0A2R6XYU5_9BACL|nr:MAG: putative sugar ABC transporter precursor [Candidatus Carbobacillus altaicus]